MIWQWSLSIAVICLATSRALMQWSRPWLYEWNLAELGSLLTGLIGVAALIVGINALIWWR